MLRNAALAALMLPDYQAKLAAVLALDEHMPLDTAAQLQQSGTIPGREAHPQLVPPSQLPKRAMNTVEGRATLLHALAHIEMNAIDLALDIVWRFAGMPELFYREWIKVAREEAYHFSLLNQHLHVLGYGYGDFPAHQSLWEMAEKTRSDLLARLALVPRTYEARGLDVTPGVRDKLRQAGDLAAAEILDIILHDEIGHVEIGNRWYKTLCAERGLDPVATYPLLSEQYAAPHVRGPFNLAARRQAGFTEQELDALLWLAKQPPSARKPQQKKP